MQKCFFFFEAPKVPADPDDASLMSEVLTMIDTAKIEQISPVYEKSAYPQVPTVFDEQIAHKILTQYIDCTKRLDFVKMEMLTVRLVLRKSKY
jgi:hypothetical protein